ncbi:HMGL-like protein [Segatella oris F0302]|uniref:HMGL-like protein n=2 Tax=Segatella oris TaxID=28135 RepID=D1QMX3_9BACT|nr:HMGL-like protein [Segatella oris F0302]
MVEIHRQASAFFIQRISNTYYNHIMGKKIQFSLVYRDMWQSSGKFQPRKDQLERIAPVFVEMGCFARVETNGGAFEQVNLLAGENPNEAVRAFCKPLHEAGIKTHMLDRGLNALRMYPVPDDVRALMYKVKHAQGTDITRIFDGLNDVRNIKPSIKWAKEAGMTAQTALCITTSPVHTLEYYTKLADELIEAGAEEICLKDMAGIGQPAFLGKLTKAIKTKHPDIIIEYHGHSGPGLSMASILEVCNNGADIIDTAIEPLSWGKVHPDIISVLSMLRNEGFEVPDINMNAYMKARALTQEFIDEWLGYFINPANKYMSSLLLGCGLPGGMMGSMMADLGGIRQTINNLRKKKGEEELSMDDMLVKLFNEVEYVWPRVGYPPLVTPFSQYTKNIALMNLLTMEQGKGRFVMMDESMWGMILGKSGKVPGKIDPELVELAKKQGREFTDVDPRTLLTNALEDFKKEMDENGWDYGQDDEELFELAMHPEQYRNYKSGQAKKNFLEDLQKAKDAKLGAKVSLEEAAAFKHAKADAIVAPVKGQIFWEFQGDGEAAPAIEPFIGKEYKEGDTFCYICTPWGEFEAIPAALGGQLVEINAKQGSKVSKGDVIAYIQRPEAE